MPNRDDDANWSGALSSPLVYNVSAIRINIYYSIFCYDNYSRIVCISGGIRYSDMIAEPYIWHIFILVIIVELEMRLVCRVRGMSRPAALFFHNRR